MEKITFPYGKIHKEIAIPSKWLGEVRQPPEIAPQPDVSSLIVTAINNPIGAPQLSELIKPEQSIAIIIDDYTRKTPVHIILPELLEQIRSRGVSKSNIKIITALGTHRPMTENEITKKVGEKVAEQYEIINSPSTSDDEKIYIGTSSNDIPAYVNRSVAEADIRIGVGMITPHLSAGFTGGSKIILPGVCSKQTVETFHSREAFIPENQLGKIDAPLRIALEQFVEERVPLDFIINVITNIHGEIYQCVAGHSVKSHRQGVEFAKQAFGVKVKHKYPIVIANSYPYDQDLWQSIKGLACGDLVTSDGGTCILITSAKERHSNYPEVPYDIGISPDKLRHNIKLGKVKDYLSATNGVLWGQMKKRIKIALVSDGLKKEDAEIMKVAYYNSVEEAVETEVKKLPEEEQSGSVVILPLAGVTLPTIQ